MAKERAGRAGKNAATGEAGGKRAGKGKKEKNAAAKEARKRFEKRLEKARARSVLEHEYPELVTTAGLSPEIKDDPPLIYHPRELGH